MKDGFICVAAGTPKVRVADCRYNAEQIFTMMREAEKQGVKILALPELCLTGYTCGDLFLQDTLLNGAAEGLRTILEATRHLEVLTALGMPVRAGGKLFNCAVVIQKGKVLGVVPKTYLPNYGEFYEMRWFQSGADCGDDLQPFDDVLAFRSYRGIGQCLIDCPTVPGLKVGVELCEDLWAADPPSRRRPLLPCAACISPSWRPFVPPAEFLPVLLLSAPLFPVPALYHPAEKSCFSCKRRTETLQIPFLRLHRRICG